MILPRQSILSPPERQSEMIFGLIMALSITGSISIARSGEAEIRTMLVELLACNVAWGLVDALMYLVAELLERHRGVHLFHAVRVERDPERARRMIAERLPPLLAENLDGDELAELHRKLTSLPAAPRSGLTGRDLLGALAVFLIVLVSTLPVAAPFLLPLEPRVALRASNGVALVMLFVLGWRMARYAGGRPFVTGLVAATIGAALVAVTIALGG